MSDATDCGPPNSVTAKSSRLISHGTRSASLQGPAFVLPSTTMSRPASRRQSTSAVTAGVERLHATYAGSSAVCRRTHHSRICGTTPSSTSRERARRSGHCWRRRTDRHTWRTTIRPPHAASTTASTTRCDSSTAGSQRSTGSRSTSAATTDDDVHEPGNDPMAWGPPPRGVEHEDWWAMRGSNPRPPRCEDNRVAFRDDSGLQTAVQRHCRHTGVAQCFGVSSHGRLTNRVRAMSRRRLASSNRQSCCSRLERTSFSRR